MGHVQQACLVTSKAVPFRHSKSHRLLFAIYIACDYIFLWKWLHFSTYRSRRVSQKATRLSPVSLRSMLADMPLLRLLPVKASLTTQRITCPPCSTTSLLSDETRQAVQLWRDSIVLAKPEPERRNAALHWMHGALRQKPRHRAAPVLSELP